MQIEADPQTMTSRWLNDSKNGSFSSQKSAPTSPVIMKRPIVEHWTYECFFSKAKAHLNLSDINVTKGQGANNVVNPVWAVEHKMAEKWQNVELVQGNSGSSGHHHCR